MLTQLRTQIKGREVTHKMTLMSVDPGLNTGIVLISYSRKDKGEQVKILRHDTIRADTNFRGLMREILSNVPTRPTLYICEDFRLRVSEAKGAANNDPNLYASQLIGALKWELPPDRLVFVEPSRMSACSLDELDRLELNVKTPHEISALRHAIAYARRKTVRPPVKNAGPKVTLRKKST